MTGKLDAGTVGRDIARFGGATVVALVMGVIQVFVIPRRVDIATYGEYRRFLVYVTYIGVLHVGLADGAFLRWAGQPAGVIRREWPRVAAWLAAIHGALLVAAIGVSLVASLPPMYLIVFGIWAFTANAGTLSGYALQAAGDFRGAGRVTALTSAVFVAAILVVPMHSLGFLLSASVVASAATAITGAVLVARLHVTEPARAPTAVGPATFRALVRSGLPVMGANAAAVLSQFADRILVSVSVPVTAFALYGFASTTMVAVSSATQALARVALSHAAHRPADTGERARFMGGFYFLVAAAFGAALAGLPLFEHLVARLLIAYVPALPIVRALVIGAPFWIAIHVVLVGTLQAHGFVQWQLRVELIGLALVVVACAICLERHTPLWEVAGAATSAAVVTWIVGIWCVTRLVTPSRAQPSRAFALIVGAQTVALLVALTSVTGWIAQSLVYATLAGAPTVIAIRAARAHDWR